jgi:hypothetical protein
MTTLNQLIARQMDRMGTAFMNAMGPASGAEFFAANRNGFSAAWVAGHMACVYDLFSSWFSGELLFEDSFHALFNETDVAAPGPVSKAASVHPGCYSKALLLHRFNQAWVKAARTLNAFDVSRWDAPAPSGAPVSLITGGAVWEVLGLHVGWHCGELAGSMPRFYDTYALNTLAHYGYVPPE